MLPLTPPDKYDSPYASLSAFAGWKDLTDSDRDYPMDEDTYWLTDWALFCAIKENQNGKPWYEWPEALKNREKEAIEPFLENLEPYIQQQRTFNAEWQELRTYANSIRAMMCSNNSS